MSSAVVDRLEAYFTGSLEISHLLFSVNVCCFDSTTSSMSELHSSIFVESDTLFSLVIPRLNCKFISEECSV